MEKKSSLCVLLLVMLLIDSVILEKIEDGTDDETVKSRQKRYALPLVYYGAVISYELYLTLAAAFTAAVVLGAVSNVVSSDSHSCANNRGWCRQDCFGHEYVDWSNTPVCGEYYCCRPY